MLGGEASNGLYLVKLWAHTGETEFLQGAERCAIWLEEQMVRDEIGTYCYVDPFKRLGFGMNVFLGAAHGISGVAHFLVSLAEQTGNERWAELARELFATLTRYARPVHG
jgi:lantibiotic modifying enzyme